ncbi:Y-family DNA polymerase [Echinimonas agarilytica]|uniref:DNA polymerase Y family protein n=1 Tax=Echinimonas agarilytica TaxID=1215918 RepID=A0AA41W9G5_9GAMM|nr:DNA polymerase Y family protein [Echinimonas agarilytica]MCM2681092.1 DNA polymerase Y family protein [Echinimonas agarilytica]
MSRIVAWLFVDFAHLQADALAAQHEAMSVIVLDARKRVMQCSEFASAAGIHCGMSVAKALALAPDTAVRMDDNAYQQQLLSQISESCYDVCAQLAIQFNRGILFETRSMWRLFGGRQSYWQVLEQRLHQAGFRYYAAAGVTPMAAYTLAQAKQHLPMGSERELDLAVADLTVTQLPLEPPGQSALTGVGMKTLRDLLHIPMADWKIRFGGEIAAWLAAFKGEKEPHQKYTEPAWFKPLPHFEYRWNCLHEISYADGLLFPLQRILKLLGRYLQRRQFAAQSVCMTLEHREQPDTELIFRMAEPEHRADEFMQIAQLRIHQMPLSEPVQSLVIKVENLVLQQAPASDLFIQNTGLGLSDHQLLSRLQSRLTSSAVMRIKSAPDPRPERSWACVKPAAKAAFEPEFTVRQRRPNWLLPQPQPLIRKSFELQTAPERIVSGWWDNQPVQRDYFIARDADDQLCWIFRDAQGQWFTHGWFG